jgi:uncharacterized membrane protein
MGLLIVILPLTAWYLSISFWDTLMLDIGFMLLYLVYGYFYHWLYNVVFPPPTSDFLAKEE